MIKFVCTHFVGDRDCAKCTLHRYIFDCDGCEDFDDWLKPKKVEKNDN